MKLSDCPFGRNSAGLQEQAWWGVDGRVVAMPQPGSVSAPCSISLGCWLWVRARRPAAGLGKRLMRGRAWQCCRDVPRCAHWPGPPSLRQCLERSCKSIDQSTPPWVPMGEDGARSTHWTLG